MAVTAPPAMVAVAVAPVPPPPLMATVGAEVYPAPPVPIVTVLSWPVLVTVIPRASPVEFDTEVIVLEFGLATPVKVLAATTGTLAAETMAKSCAVRIWLPYVAQEMTRSRETAVVNALKFKVRMESPVSWAVATKFAVALAVRVSVAVLLLAFGLPRFNVMSP